MLLRTYTSCCSKIGIDADICYRQHARRKFFRVSLKMRTMNMAFVMRALFRHAYPKVSRDMPLSALYTRRTRI